MSYIKPPVKLLSVLLLLNVLVIFSCQKADPGPIGIPASTLPKNIITPPSFLAQINGSSTLSFTPKKSISGGNVSLIGTNTSYTITLTFPSTTGPGGVFYSSKITASIYDGSNTYVANGTTGSGSLTIDSISNGRYYGSFQFIGEDPSLNSENVNAGIFKDL